MIHGLLYNQQFKYQGESHTCREWSKKLNIPYNSIYFHLKKGKSIAFVLKWRKAKALKKQLKKEEDEQ